MELKKTDTGCGRRKRTETQRGMTTGEIDAGGGDRDLRTVTKKATGNPKKAQTQRTKEKDQGNT